MHSALKEVQAWTDGSCSPNPGKGGWASIMLYKDSARIIGGYQRQTTNNRMELEAVLRTLMALKSRCALEIVTDSQYVIGGLSKVFIRHIPKMNYDLWGRISDLIGGHSITVRKVKGHSGNPLNELADAYAVYCRENMEYYDTLLEDARKLTSKRMRA